MQMFFNTILKHLYYCRKAIKLYFPSLQYKVRDCYIDFPDFNCDSPVYPPMGIQNHFMCLCDKSLFLK